MDEAGRGPLAGPVVASAVIVRDFSFVSRIDDSKKLSALQRERAFEEIHAKCEVALAVVDHERIDEVNILKATLQAMREAVMKLGILPGCLLVDGPHVPEVFCTRFPVIDGDAKSFSIACASIIAKVTRDRMMQAYDLEYPGYGFGAHKGYGTKSHIAAIREKGPCKIHRKTFEPIRTLMNVK